MNEENAIVKKANDLIEHARYDLSLTQEYLILYLISLIRTEDTDFQTYNIPVAKLVDLFGSTALYTRIKYEAQNLLKKTITIEEINENNKKSVLITTWFSSLRYMEGSGFIQVRFDPALKPYLLQLKERFTEYLLKYAIPLHSTHIIRIYELLKQHQYFGYRHFDLEEFKHLLALDNKPAYFSYGLIKQRILLPAIERISKYTDLQITDFKEEKFSRKVVGFTFYFKIKSASELPQTIEIDSNSKEPSETPSEPAKEPSETTSESPEIPSETIPEPAKEAPEPAKEALANIVQAPVNDSDMQERRLNFLYLQIPEKHRSSNIKDIIRQFLTKSDDCIISNIQYTIKQDPENFAGYLYKALENDFAKEIREKKDIPREDKAKLKAEWWKKRIDEAIAILPPEKKQELLEFVETEVAHKAIENTPEAKEKAFRGLVKQELEMEGVKCPYED